MSSEKKKNVELSFGFEQYLGLAVAGFISTLPMASWIGGMSLLLLYVGSHKTNGPIWWGFLGIIAAPAMLIFPALLPCLVLRARQPRGARIEWDDDGVTEWDGVWRKNSIPWDRIEVARVEWKILARNSRMSHALQMFDATSDAVITAWETKPENAPLIRRRLESGKLDDLLAALRDHHAPFSRVADWQLAEEPGRRRLKWIWLARMGYIGGFLAPLIAFPSPIPGVMLGAISSALLAWRALSVFHELRALRSRLRMRDRNSDDAPLADPYRAVNQASSEHGASQIIADKLKMRAVVVEAIVRGTFIVLPVASSVVAALAEHQ